MSTADRIKARWNKAGHKEERSLAGAHRGPLTHRFGGEYRSADGTIRIDMPLVRARSRAMEDGPVITSFLNSLIGNVLGGTGMHFQMKVRTSKLFGDKTDGEPDEQANDIIETAYRKATNRDNYLVSADMSKRLADEMKLRRMAIDGEIFIRTYRPFDNEAGIARQLIDPDTCDINYNRPEIEGGGQIRMGVELDRYGRRVAYHFLTQQPGDYQYQHKPAVRERVEAKYIRHLFVPLRPGQTRGIPWTSPALLSIRQLEAFVDAAVVNARIGAARNVYYEKDFPTGWSPADGVTVPGDTGAIVDDLREGESLELPCGVHAKMLDTRFPDETIDPFTKTAMRFNAMGLGTSYMTLSGDLSEANFSSLRAGLNEERTLWSRLQSFFIESDCIPDFEEWFRHALSFQKVKLPEGKFDKFNAPVITGRRWASVNPLQDIQADREAMEALVMSPQEVIRARSGDPDEVLTQIAEFRDAAAAKKLSQATSAKPAQPGQIDTQAAS